MTLRIKVRSTKAGLRAYVGRTPVDHPRGREKREPVRFLRRLRGLYPDAHITTPSGIRFDRLRDL